VYGDEQRAFGILGDGHEVLDRIVRNLTQMRQDDDTQGWCGEKGVAVGRRLDGRLDADGAGGAALVVDEELLANGARQAVCERPGRIIRTPPGA
jgi:hypothetical protein